MLKFPSHIRWQIIEKSLAGISKQQIAIQLGISKSTVRRVYRHFKQYGCIENLPSLRGRPRIFRCDDMKYLETLLKEKVDWYIWELQSQMEFWLGRNLDLSVIWKAIHRLGYTHKQVLKIYKYYILHSLFTVFFIN
jgi:transposase